MPVLIDVFEVVVNVEREEDPPPQPAQLDLEREIERVVRLRRERDLRLSAD